MSRVERAREEEADEELQRALARDDVPWGRALAFVARMLWRHPWLVTASLVLGIAIAAAEVLSLALILPFLDSLGTGGGSLSGETKLAFLVPYFEGVSIENKIRFIAGGILGIQVVKGLLTYVAGRVASYQRVLLDRDLRTEIFHQIVDLDLRYINREKVANLYTILHSYPSDVASVGQVLVNALPRTSSFVGYAFAMILLSWKLTILALVLAALTTATINFLSRIIRRMSRKINVYRVRLQHVSLESLNGLKLIHLFGREDQAKRQFETQLKTYQVNRYRRSSVNAAVSPLYSVMMTGMFAGVLIGGTFLMNRSAETWVLLLTMFMVVMFKLMAPTASYARTKAKISEKLPSLEEIMSFLERGDKPFMKDGSKNFQSLRREVRLEGVWFRYDPDEPYVLKDIDITIPKGQVVALVGGSGAGKSTLVDLIARLYDPTKGTISADGKDLRSLKVDSWRARLAVVSQQTFLFHASVRENIRFGRLDASDAEIEAAARQANAHEFIEALPEGYETMLGDRGVRLSGGQAQRIAIARAILADPDLLILDEATSALDAATERKVQEALERVARGRTVIAIAHRLSTIRAADKIIVLEAGRVVEQGDHDMLLAREGHYHRYVAMQDLSQGGPPEGPAMRIVLSGGLDRALLKDNGSVVKELPVRTNATDLAGDDGVLLKEGESEGTVRIGDATYEDVPIYWLAGANGDREEVRVRVRGLRTREGDATPRQR